jgi:hypothetical protein
MVSEAVYALGGCREILDIRDLIGYRRHMVFLHGSLHSPPHYDYVRDAMTALQECFESEDDAFVRAVLGHWLFGFIHTWMEMVVWPGSR